METSDKVPVLIIALVDSFTVELVRGDFVSDLIWLQLTNWWSDGSAPFESTGKIQIAISDFILKREWLRSNWASLNRKVEYSEEVKQVLVSSREQLEEIRDLISAKKIVNPIDFSNLQLRGERQVQIYFPNQQSSGCK